MKKYPKKTLGELCNIIKGETGIVSATPGEYPLVVTAKERKTSATYQFDTQAVCIPLVSSSGHGKKSLNYVHYQEGKFALGTILAAIIPKNHNEISAAFLHQYLFFYKDTKIVPLMRGAANVSLAVKDIAKIEIPIPPINDQKDFIIIFNKLQKFYYELIREFDNQEKYISQLKQAILQEAISGQITAEWRKQNPMQKGDLDTDAAALLAKIKAEKQQLIADGKLKKEKPLSEILPDEIPFSLPDSWAWCRLERIVFDTEAGKSPKCLNECVNDKEWGVIKTTAIQELSFLQEENKILPTDFIVNSMCIIHKNDLLITRAGPINRVGIACCVKNITKNLILSDKTIRIKYVKQFIEPDYLAISINSREIKKILKLKMTGMADSQVNITQENIKVTSIPLPPLAEQKAIVEKVDYLMKIIDQLEEQIKHRKQLAEDLMQTVLREAFV